MLSSLAGHSEWCVGALCTTCNTFICPCRMADVGLNEDEEEEMVMDFPAPQMKNASLPLRRILRKHVNTSCSQLFRCHSVLIKWLSHLHPLLNMTFRPFCCWCLSLPRTQRHLNFCPNKSLRMLPGNLINLWLIRPDYSSISPPSEESARLIFIPVGSKKHASLRGACLRPITKWQYSIVVIEQDVTFSSAVLCCCPIIALSVFIPPLWVMAQISLLF